MIGIVGAVFVTLLVGLFFGVAGGMAYAEPKYRDPNLHEGDWERVQVAGTLVMWQRKGGRRKKCHDDHRAYVCTIDTATRHVDACDCGKTRQGVYGQWC